MRTRKFCLWWLPHWLVHSYHFHCDCPPPHFSTETLISLAPPAASPLSSLFFSRFLCTSMFIKLTMADMKSEMLLLYALGASHFIIYSRWQHFLDTMHLYNCFGSLFYLKLKDDGFKVKKVEHGYLF